MYRDFHKDKDKFDFSKYSDNLKLNDKLNKKVIWKMKDKTKDVPTAEFIRLKSKIYKKR